MWIKDNFRAIRLTQSVANIFVICSFILVLSSCGESTSNLDETRVINAEITNLKVHFPYDAPKYSWAGHYGESLYRYLSERSELSSILYVEINPADLRLLKCSNYKMASLYERKRFWILYLASIAHAESGLNPLTTYRERDGSLSSGLLQVDIASANRHTSQYTGMIFSQKDLFNTDLNLMAGLYILKHQLEGGINGERPDVRGRLFTDRSYYWSVLTSKRELIMRTFVQNARVNLPFCSI